MENASKALIIAGAVLVAILIISLGIVIFRNMSNSVTKNVRLDEQEITSFNSKITPYIGNNKSGSQVNALKQLVTTIDYNAISENDTIRRITLKYGSNNLVSINSSNKVDAKANLKTGVYYNVSAKFGDNGLINEIIITDAS